MVDRAAYFPSLVERGETFVAYLYDGYWIDIGAPDKYTQVHRDIMDGRFLRRRFWTSRRHERWSRRPPASQGRGDHRRSLLHRPRRGRRKGRARGPVLGDRSPDTIDEGASIEGAILWPNCHVGRDALVHNAILGRDCQLGRGARVTGGTVLGDHSMLTDYTRT